MSTVFTTTPFPKSHYTQRVSALKTEKSAFTLAEILVSLIILGIVAVMAIPSAMKQNTLRAKRTSIAKALATYEKTFQKFIIEHEYPSNNDDMIWKITKLGSYDAYVQPYAGMSFSDLSAEERSQILKERRAARAEYNAKYNNGQCDSIRKQFNVSEVSKISGCIFKTKDGIWWKIADVDGKSGLDQVIVTYDKQKGKEIIEADAETLLSKAKDYYDYDAFWFYSVRDDNGIWFSNTISKITTDSLDNINNQNAIIKTYDFIKNQTTIEDIPCSEKIIKNCISKVKCYEADGCSIYKNDDKGLPTYRSSGCDNKGKNCSCVYNKNCYRDWIYDGHKWGVFVACYNDETNYPNCKNRYGVYVEHEHTYTSYDTTDCHNLYKDASEIRDKCVGGPRDNK